MFLAAVSLALAEGEVVAKFGETELRAEQFRAWIETLEPNSRAALVADPTMMSQVARSYSIQQLVLQEALAKKWDQRPEVTAQAEQARQNAIVENYLESLSRPPASYPGESELRAAYEVGKPALLVPRQYRLAQIYIPLAKDADKGLVEKERERLDTVRARLRKSPADFAVIAAAESGDKSSSDRGGEIGWLTEAQIQPELRPSILSLTKGTVSEAIQLGDGWHILKALDIKDAYTPTFEAVRSQLVQQLRGQRAKVERQAYLAGLLKDHPVAINELAFSTVLGGADRPVPAPSRESNSTRPVKPSFK